MPDQSRQPDDSGPIDPPQRRRSTDRAGDPRLDKLQTWALALVAGAALGLGSYFYQQLVTATRDVIGEVKAARSDISAIGTRVAILESARSTERLDEHVRALEQRMAVVEAQKGGKNP